VPRNSSTGAADGTTFVAIGGLPPSEALVRDNHP
jgi:hypothetical protein